MKENSAGRREGPSGIEGASGDQPSSAATGEIRYITCRVVLKCVDYRVIFALGLSLHGCCSGILSGHLTRTFVLVPTLFCPPTSTLVPRASPTSMYMYFAFPPFE